ncbi:hypothetical protein QBC46DRAFT_339474 [Diplogelasinospora grovesii]|uniref:Uncharacterized protein n=1 Tax=Diplogelasinospora grovesii TaxID=303347 RepID=A0AAN6NB47_9PEZI|nr:hypothetical protein QBC46DRAFT_339474 [Diplogelasinospora grovesii]
MSWMKKWQNASTLDQKNIATAEGTVAVQHAQVLGQLLSTGLAAANNMVANMTRQTKSINSSMAAQLVIIDAKLGELQGSLDEAQAKEKALEVALWVSVACAVAGLGLISKFFFGFIALATPLAPFAPFIIGAGGIIFVGSVVGIAVAGSLLGTLKAAISQLESAISDLQTQKTQLLAIQASFQNLQDDYGGLSGFWLNMLSAAGQITTLESLGVVMDNLNQYVATLGSQGITPPAPAVNALAFAVRPPAHVRDPATLEAHIEKFEDQPKRQRALKLEAVNHLVAKAT